MGTRIVISGTAAEKAAEKGAEKLVEEMLAAGLQSAQQLVPVKTGALHDSLHSEQDGTTGAYGSDLDYSVFVEMGTFKMAAQPYLMPSLDAVRRVAGG